MQTLDQWYDENSFRGLVKYSFKKRVCLWELVEQDLAIEAADALPDDDQSPDTHKFIAENLEFEGKDLTFELDIEICIQRKAHGKYNAFINSVRAY
jgi:hypothetical protein